MSGNSIFGPRSALNRMASGKVVVELYPTTDDESDLTYRIAEFGSGKGKTVTIRYDHGTWNHFSHINDFIDNSKDIRFKEADRD